MYNTDFTKIVTTNWTLVSIGISGFITNNSGHDILYLEAETLPPSTLKKGHVLHPQDSIGYNLKTGHQVYSRSINSDSEIVVTKGSFSLGGNGSAKNLYLDIAIGNVPGHSSDSLLSFNPGVNSVAEETVWDQGGIYTYLTSNTELFISSSSALDANIVLAIEGMTDDFVKKNTTFTFSAGQSQTSIGDFFRIFRVTVISGDAPQGDLYISESDTLTDGMPNDITKIKAKVFKGVNVTRSGIITVPENHTLYIIHGASSTRKSKDAVIIPFVRPFGAPSFIETTQFPSFQSNIEFTLPVPFKVSEKTDIEIKANTTTNGTEIAASFTFILIDNSIE